MGNTGSLHDVRAATQQRYERVIKGNRGTRSVLSVQLEELYSAYKHGRLKSSRPEVALLKGEIDLYWNWRVLRTLRNMANESASEANAQRIFRRIKAAEGRMELFDPQGIKNRLTLVDTLIPFMCEYGFMTNEIRDVNLFLADFLPLGKQIVVRQGKETSDDGETRRTYSFWLDTHNVGAMQTLESASDEPPSSGALLLGVRGDGKDSTALWVESFSMSLGPAMLRQMEGRANSAFWHWHRMLQQMKMDAPRLIASVKHGISYTNEGMQPGAGYPATTIWLKADLQSLPPENFNFSISLADEGSAPWLFTSGTVQLGSSDGKVHLLIASFPDQLWALRKSGEKVEVLNIGGVYSFYSNGQQN